MESTSTFVYPLVMDNTFMMSIEALERTSVSQICLEMPPIVRAASMLPRDSTTEIIDVNKLCQKSTSALRYVEIADEGGRLYCLDALVSTSCWLKVIAFAKDCQSCNVLLMTTDSGVMLKTVRCITPGEPLLMWFAESILAMMNMPFLTPSNIQGQNRYICHMCDNLFEYPNPLKIHLALKCNRLETNHLWSMLAKEFSLSPRSSSLSFNLFPPTFRFELTTSNIERTTSTRISPILVETMDSGASPTDNNSPSSSNQPSPSSSNQPSLSSSNQPSPSSSNQPSPSPFDQTTPSSSGQPSPCSSAATASPSPSTQISPVRAEVGYRHSAFRPYSNQNSMFATAYPLNTDDGILTRYNMQTTGTPISAEMHAAQMETLVSNLGKSKRGHLCIYCGKVYSRKYGLKIHIRTHTGYKPLKCRYCLRPFGDPSNLNKHVRLHSDGDNTPYRCHYCGKVLVRRRDLERHVRSRHMDNVEQILAAVPAEVIDAQ